MDWYRNPIKKHGDFADPFVLRYNGKYYLYCTNPDVRCWSSCDLIDWHAEGATIEPGTFPELVPFAPEVVYWNGSFYMYTSPSGFGHYVLKSDSPTGPFRKNSGNVGHNIDGSVFIDDDGKWYFYWADDSGILGCRMVSPTEFGEPVNTGAFMNGWTEGPFIVKHNDRYHMTYTGNHYLSHGYRINAAVSDDPLQGYADNERNPIIIHTNGSGVGLGHSSTVLGPDLHSHYIVYHNINADASRDLNIDALFMDDEGIYVYGPTRDKQPVPRAPEFYDRFDTEQSRKNWDVLCGEFVLRDGCYVCGEGPFRCLGKTAVTGSGVIEFNLWADKPENSDYGILIKHKGDFCTIRLNPARDDVRLVDAKGECITAALLPRDFSHTALHCLHIRCEAGSAILHIDGRRQLELGPVIGAGDLAGYFSEGVPISIGYTAYSTGTAEEAKDESYMPVPGGMPLRGRTMIDRKINVAKNAGYTFNVIGFEPFLSESNWDVELDNVAIEAKVIIKRNSCTATLVVNLPQGLHALKIAPHGGALYRWEAYETSLIDNRYKEFARLGPHEKAYVGDEGMNDYTVEAEFAMDPQTPGGTTGLLFRVTEPSEGGEGNDRVLGINFFKGYCVSFGNGSVTLTKHSYDEKELIRKDIVGSTGTHRMRVEATADYFSVFVDGNEKPIIEYRDKNPFTRGCAGIRVRDCLVDKAAIRISKA